MLDFIKKNYINVCIVVIYTVIACLVYGIWSYSAWHLWYVTFIIVLAITVAGVLIGYFWLRNNKIQDQQNDSDQNQVV